MTGKLIVFLWLAICVAILIWALGGPIMTGREALVAALGAFGGSALALLAFGMAMVSKRGKTGGHDFTYGPMNPLALIGQLEFAIRSMLIDFVNSTGRDIESVRVDTSNFSIEVLLKPEKKS